MLFDKLFKKKSASKGQEPPIVEEDIVNESSLSTNMDKVNVSSTVYEKPDMEFLKDEPPLEDVLKELGFDASDASLEGMDQEEYIKSMLDQANDVLSNNVDLDKLMSGSGDYGMELEALKASLSTAKKTDKSTDKSGTSASKSPSNISQFDNNDAVDQSEYDMLFGATDFDNIDSLIDSALERDRQEENLSSFDDANLDFINDTSVFQEDIPDEVKYTKPKPKYVLFLENASPKKLYIIAGALGFLIIVIIAATSFIALNNTRASIIAGRAGGAVISQPKAPVNNANYIYVNLGLKFNDDTLVLNKILVDLLCTGFYFNKQIDLNSFDISLTDDQGKSYAPDQLFMSTLDNTSELRFQPLEPDVRFFFLSISDLQTGEKVVYEFSLNGKIILPEGRHVGKSKDLLSYNPDLKIFIEKIDFSSSGTYLNYSLHWSDDYMVPQLGRKNETQKISIVEDSRNLSPVSRNTREYVFDNENILLGTMEFVPLKSLNSNITIKFTDLYRKFNLDTVIPSERLFMYKTEDEIVIDLYDYKLILERAGWQGEKLILVCHSEASNLYAISGISQDNDNRTEIILDVVARINTSEGEIVLEGDNRSSALGTDIIFEAKDVYGKVRTSGYENIVFEISNVYIKNEDISVAYKIDEKRSRPDAESSFAEANFTDAFERRLAFKSGIGDIFSITGFSEELVAHDRLIKDYPPNIDTEAVYAAQVLTMSLLGDNAYAVISEYWKGHVDGQLETMTRLHKIKATAGEYGWIIVEDEIIG